MTRSPTSSFFDAAHAAAYDQQFARVAPLRDVLQLVTRLALSSLPSEARVLCVGVGTGIELLDLARTFPGWSFTCVEPAPAMLDVCRQKVAASGLSDRCLLHEGYLESLPPQAPFDAATALLVSHFLVEPAARRGFFAEIASRLRLGGRIVCADLATGASSATFESLFEIWGRAMLSTGVTAEQLARMRAAYGRDVAVVAPDEVERIIEQAGFDAPVRCLQALLIHAWTATRVR